MPRINWNAIDKEEDAIVNDESLTPAEKQKEISRLHREAREEYQEQQRDEMSDEFGY